MNKNNIKISASILEADFSNLKKEIEFILSNGVDSIHFDVMDNNYVPNITFGPCILKSIKKYVIKNEIHVHLMIYNIENIIIDFIKSGADLIMIHPETSNHILRLINIIKKNNCKVGLVINPTTQINILHDVINYIDVITLMSVEPGFSNQEFIKETFYKIEKVRKIIDFYNKNILLAVDGGINYKNVKLIADLGVNILIIGSAIFNKKNNYKKNIEIIINNLYK